MWKNKKTKKQSMESVELNEDQLDAVSGGLVVQNPYTGKWFAVSDKGETVSGQYSTKAGAQWAAVMCFRSTSEISWDDYQKQLDANVAAERQGN